MKLFAVLVPGVLVLIGAAIPGFISLFQQQQLLEQQVALGKRLQELEAPKLEIRVQQAEPTANLLTPETWLWPTTTTETEAARSLWFQRQQEELTDDQLAERTSERRWLEIAEIVEAVMEREKKLYPNVDFTCAYAYRMLGLPVEAYTPVFAASRIVGWAAHVIEQHADNRLIRPDSIYRGQRNQTYVPVGQRS